jgi:hypothetical protein
MPSDSVWFVEWSEDGGKTWGRCDDHDETRDCAQGWADKWNAHPNRGHRLYRVSEYRRVEPNEGGK